jgi:hypothetical protein
MQLKTRVWGLGKFLLLVGALAATFLVFAAASMRVALRAREVRVPGLVGHTVNDASDTLAGLGLSLRIDPNQRPDEKVPAGRVMLQDPAPGAAARQQRTIRVWVSSGPRTDIGASAGRANGTHRAHAHRARRPGGWLADRIPISLTTLPTRSSRRIPRLRRARPRSRCCSTAASRRRPM